MVNNDNNNCNNMDNNNSNIKKYIVVSTNNNPDYYHYLPYIEKAWATYGWDLCVMLTHDVDVNRLEVNRKETLLCVFPRVDELRTETVAQASRLYASHYLPKDALIMTSDMDLLPLTNYWNPNPNDITSYGHDLTWNTFIPMGYCAMLGSKWAEVLNLTHDPKADMLRDANEPNIPHSPLSDKWEDYWNFDWCLLTRRLKPYYDKITFIKRGQIDLGGATLALGRVDRYNWKETQKQPNWIDAHCHNNNVRHPDKLNDFLSIFNKIHGEL